MASRNVQQPGRWLLLLRDHPALVLSVPMAVLAVSLHLMSQVTPALVTDLLAFLFAAVSGRRLLIGALGVGLTLAVAALQPPEWPTLAEYSSIIPIAVAVLQGKTRSAVLFAAGYLVVLVAEAESTAEFVQRALVWFTVYALTWAVTDLINQARRARQRVTHKQLVEQRHAIARELHDTVAHELSLMSMQVQRLGLRGDLDPDELESILDSCDNAIAQLRAMLSVLRSPDSPRTTLAEAPSGSLDEQCQAAVARLIANGFKAEYQRDGDPDEVPAAAQWALAGLCREAVSNIITHGDRNSPVTISLEAAAETGETRLAFFNRVGPRAHVPDHTPLGLIGLRERVEAVGGRLYAYASAGNWTTMACVPNRSRAVAKTKESRND